MKNPSNVINVDYRQKIRKRLGDSSEVLYSMSTEKMVQIFKSEIERKSAGNIKRSYTFCSYFKM